MSTEEKTSGIRALVKIELPRGKGPGLGAIFVGDKGKIEINRNKLAANPPELIRGAHRRPTSPSTPASPTNISVTGSNVCEPALDR